MKKRRILCLISYIGYKLKVNRTIINIAENKERAGVKYLKIWFIISDEIRVLLKSFKASLIGWRIPINPTLLGPFRNWI